jgi:peptide/nickel transport system permease protein
VKKIISIVIQFVLSCIGIILVGALPVLLGGLNTGKLAIQSYWEAIVDITNAIFHVNELTYVVISGQVERDLFPSLWDPITYSLTVLFAALCLACFIALFLTVITMMLSERLRSKVKMVFYLFESVPDLLVIMLLQMFVIFFYKQTGVLLVEIAAVGEQKVYMLPILCLSILPTIQLYRLAMLTFEDESRRNYVELIHSLGFGRLYIILVHIFRNAIISVFFQSKKTVWFMLSNLFILELLFNIPGITRFLMSTPQPKIFSVALLAFFVPIFTFYTLGEWLLARKVNSGEVI